MHCYEYVDCNPGKSTEVADVVVGIKAVCHPNIKACVAGHAELAGPLPERHPGVRSVQFVVATARHAFHDFGCTGVERQAWRAGSRPLILRVPSAKREAVADAFAVESTRWLGW
jgi:hypothetical protein